VKSSDEESAAPSTPPASAGKSAGGWQAKPDGISLAVKDGELIVTSTGSDPWIKTEDISNKEDSFVLELDVLTEQEGGLQVFAGWGGKGFAAGSAIQGNVPVTGQWVPVAIKIPSVGKLTALRLDLPGKQGKTRLRNIRLQDSKGGTVKQWKF
jgi:hypothetical protein